MRSLFLIVAVIAIVLATAADVDGAPTKPKGGAGGTAATATATEEGFSLWYALAIAAGVALLPAAYLAFSRKATAMADVKTRKARSNDLRATQDTLRELQEEQQRQKKQAQADERQYARELKQERETAAAEAAASKAGSRAVEGDEAWEVVDGANANATGADGDAASSSDSEEEDAPRSSAAFACVLCKKKFKSLGQSENHNQSTAHKKAVAAAERASKKK